jgi:hypothetical protein
LAFGFNGKPLRMPAHLIREAIGYRLLDFLFTELVQRPARVNLSTQTYCAQEFGPD